MILTQYKKRSQEPHIKLQAKKLTFLERYLLGGAPFPVELLIQDLHSRRPHLYNSNTKHHG